MLSGDRVQEPGRQFPLAQAHSILSGDFGDFQLSLIPPEQTGTVPCAVLGEQREPGLWGSPQREAI